MAMINLLKKDDFEIGKINLIHGLNERLSDLPGGRAESMSDIKTLYVVVCSSEQIPIYSVLGHIRESLLMCNLYVLIFSLFWPPVHYKILVHIGVCV